MIIIDKYIIEINNDYICKWQWMHSGKQWIPKNIIINSANHKK